ncbi:MAG TPA: AAA family ATPase [Deltaproteobacteria bacterium]|nr:MAG: hypothetical protein A2048_05450 [Deltaproteobacteria bacterium GWA2_45_12]HBF13404.1 AAA family ATPase [Deltaproteobacteria bacterium]
MLSIANVSGNDDASRYYEKADDYYTKDKSPSQWQGKAATALNLQGEIQQDKFKNLLAGILPNGETIKENTQGRRGGTDLTFSAPKSVSMQALIAGDYALIDAHDRAVTQALKYAETLVTYRRMVDGELKKVPTRNMLAATFRHELSRACDPQLHTHCVVLNLTQREDGKWRAMDNELFYRQKMLMGVLYRAELAREVQNLGYEVRVTHQDGRFELGHITDSQIESFSSRSQAIEEILKKGGKTRESASPQEKQLITIATRQRKTDVDRQFLKEHWKEKSLESKIHYQQKLKPQKINNLSLAHNGVQFALDHLLERQSVITQSQFLRTALQHGVRYNTFKEIQFEIDRRLKEGLLLQFGERITTPEAIKREQMTLQMEQRGRAFNRSIFGPQQVDKFLEESKLNEEQKKASQLILTSSTWAVGIQGLAGTGKTFMLKATNELAHKQGYQMVGLAPSTSATKELSKTGMESMTISAFQVPERQKKINSKTVLVIDEAGMVSSKQMEAVFRTAFHYQAKVVLVGDTQQLKAVEAGKPFAQLQAHGMPTAGMSEIQRQKEPELKKAVELAARGEIVQSIAVLDKSITEIQNEEARHAQIAKDYTELTKHEQKETLIVSGTNRAKDSINQQVRQNLGFHGKGNLVPVLQDKAFTKAQIKEIRSYKIGDIIVPERNYSTLKLKKGSQAIIKEIKNSYVILQKEDGSRIKWYPRHKNKVGVYQINQREISQGDMIRFTRNDPQKNFDNGERARVVKVDLDKTLHIQKENGHVVKITGSKPLHMDYGYCSTVHAAQGKTCEKVLIEADTKSLTSAQDNYYVAISRARQEVKIYTNDRAKLPEAMTRENPKEAALELRINPEKIPRYNPTVQQTHERVKSKKDMELDRS